MRVKWFLGVQLGVTSVHEIKAVILETAAGQQ